MMGVLLAVLVFVGVVATIGVMRTSDDDVRAFAHEPRRTPDPSPRDIHALTGTLASAPVPSWG